ncbi:MAG TPA: LCP family protein [bacterium]|nr:LCP family protein [bacterium]
MIDFREKIEQQMPELQQKRPKKNKIGLKIFGFFMVFLVLFSATVLISSEDASKVPILGKIVGLVESSDRKIKGEDQDRINILLLGIGGKNHDGGSLTDTIMLVSLQPSTKKVAMMSIPRDLMISVEGLGWQKVNAINALAEAKKEGSGGEAISQALGDILGIPIQYYVRVDFQGFINIIDRLGGLEVYVDNVLEDYSYPILGQEDNPDYYSRYEHLYIGQGWQTMDGSLALKYARSRHGLGSEGSDFARSKRQQKIIEAAKNKLLKKENLLRPAMIASIVSELNEHISYNFSSWEILKLWQNFKDVSSDDISNYVLDNSVDGLLVSSMSEGGAYILTPRSGDYTEIQYLVDNFFVNKDNNKKTVKTENNQSAKIEIKNGTWINGLASQTAIDLEKNNFTVLRISNSSQRDFSKTIIYDLSYGEKDEALKYLKDFLQADISFDIPDWLAEEIKNEIGNKETDVPDFLIILGQNASRIDF